MVVPLMVKTEVKQTRVLGRS
jgi:hypothetical protein